MKFTNLILIIIVSFFSFSCNKFNRFSVDDVDKNQSVLIEHQKDKPIRILFLGDLDFGESYQETYAENILKKQGYLYSFSKISDLIKQADFTVVNLETPLYPFNSSQAVDVNKTYLHYSDTTLAPIFLKKAGINAVSLANNHSMDFGETGLKTTINLLHKNQINFFGAGKNEIEAALPLKISFGKNSTRQNIFIFGMQGYAKVYDKKYKYFATKETAGINLLAAFKIVAEIKTVKKYDPNATIILFPHWASNYKWKGLKQIVYAKLFTFFGADLIVGHGAHCTQEIENHFGKPVFFSIGNSVFNSEGRFDIFESIKYSVLLLLEYENQTFNIKAYPILSDNNITQFQPRFLNDEEYSDFLQKVNKQSAGNFIQTISTGKDSIGNYFSFHKKK